MCERLDVIDQLLAADVDIHAETEGGPALQWAARAGKPAAVRHLVEHGADPERRDASTTPPRWDGAGIETRSSSLPAPVMTPSWPTWSRSKRTRTEAEARPQGSGIADGRWVWADLPLRGYS